MQPWKLAIILLPIPRQCPLLSPTLPPSRQVDDDSIAMVGLGSSPFYLPVVISSMQSLPPIPRDRDPGG